MLDRLLEDGRIDIEGISATSAGAMNAAVLAYGMPPAAATARAGALARILAPHCQCGLGHAPLQPSLLDRLIDEPRPRLSARPSRSSICWRGVFSPYQFNPMNFNPLRDVL